MGGNRFNAVVDALYRALPLAGVAAARFDFSSSDRASATQQTVEVIDQIVTRPVVLVGYSFGAAIATMVNDERLAGWFLIAPPLALMGAEASAIGTDARPKAMAVAEFDQFSTPAEVATATQGWTNSALHPLAGADHFLGGHLDAVVDQVLIWLRTPALGHGPADRKALSD